MYDHVELPKQYRLDHEKIDIQHAQLFACLMHMNRIIKNDDKKNARQIEESVNEVLRFLRSYAQNHFHYEEAMMKKNHCPDYEHHLKLHNDFIQKVIDIQVQGGKANKGKLVILGEVATYVKDWYLNHILQEDKKIVEFEKASEKKTGAR